MRTTPNLGLRKPDQEDFYNVDDFNTNADILDAEITAIKNQVTNASAKFDGAAGHRHTGAEGDAPPIGLDGIDAAARTSPGGTEPNRLAMTDANGRVGDSNRLGGYPASEYVRRDSSNGIPLGNTNQDILRVKGAILKTDTRTVELSYDPQGRLTNVVEKDGSTIVKTTTLTYDANGNLTQVQESAGGTTVTTTLNYSGGRLSSVSKTVT